MSKRFSFWYLSAALLFACVAHAESVSNPKASYIDIEQRRAQLAHNKDPRIAQAIASLSSCAKLPEVLAPTGHIIIPQRYLSGGHGPVNPEEGKVTRIYNNFEHRVTSGMNQWLVTGNKEEAQCAQQQIDAWAKAGTLLDYDPKESSQAWYQVEWTLSAVAISESVLVNESSLDPAQVKRDIQWMNKVAHRTVDFDKVGTQTNNHHYWRGLAAVATGVISSDDALFNWGIGVYKQGIDELDKRGAFPQEMARHERAIHYQSFALQPLTPLAAFAERQHVPLFKYHSRSGRTISDAVNFFGAAIANPEIIKAYTSDAQLLDDGSDLFAFAEFYSHYVEPAQIPASILAGLGQPTFSTRIGGSTTVIDGYTPSRSGENPE
jgi:poly(beta-D-mannuronate) lyase